MITEPRSRAEARSCSCNGFYGRAFLQERFSRRDWFEIDHGPRPALQRPQQYVQRPGAAVDLAC